MFWSNTYASSQHIDALLQKEDVSIYELIHEEDILQECKTQNKKLVEYLAKSEVIEELVSLITKEPSNDVEERLRYRYSNIACELLTCDVPTLNEKLAGDESLLDKLYSFIDTDHPLNPLLASFFSKTIGVLVTRKTDQVLEYLKSRERCVDLLLQHLETSAIMDLVLKLVTQVEGDEMRQNILNWLNSQQLVQRLVKLLSPSSDPGKHANAAQLLCDIIQAARENLKTDTKRTDPDPILYALESTETLTLLLDTILSEEKIESSIVGGIQVLFTLLNQTTKNVSNDAGQGNEYGVEECEVDNEQRIRISNTIVPYLEKFHTLLIDPPHKPPVRSTIGVLEYPLGNTRIHVAKLFVALLSTENPKISETLVDLDTFQTLLDLFFKYSWNNFLHTQVQECLALAINCDYQGTNDNIYRNIFIKCKLINRILEAWEENENSQKKDIRKGYMGHLIQIANNIVSQCENSNVLQNFLKTNVSSECFEKWETLTTTQLVTINETHEMMLGTIAPTYNTQEVDMSEYRVNSRDVDAQQAYTSYQQPCMISALIENFAFSEDQFDDNKALICKGELGKAEEIFNKICRSKQNSGLEDCGKGLEWDRDRDPMFQTIGDRGDAADDHHNLNFSDEDDDQPDVEFDEEWDNSLWTSGTPLTVHHDNSWVPSQYAWNGVPAEPVESTGWANFENFENSFSAENTNVIDNKSCEATTKLVESTTVDSNEASKTWENQIRNTAAKIIKLLDTIPSTNEEMNLNSQIDQETLNTIPTADGNANPSDFESNRNAESREESIPKDALKHSVQNDKSSSDVIQNDLSSTVVESTLTFDDKK